MSSSDRQDEVVSPWAQLVCITDIDEQPLPISGEKFTIGRGVGCDLSLHENKLVSGQHCVLKRNSDDTVTLQDTSTNGTMVISSTSKTKVTKGKVHKLKHGDEIYIVLKKEDHSKDVAYMFQELNQLLEETLVNEDLESDEECTEEYIVKKEEPKTRPADSASKRPVSEVDSTEVESVKAKRPRGDDIATAVKGSDPKASSSTSIPSGKEIANQETVSPPSGIQTASKTVAATESKATTTPAVDSSVGISSTTAAAGAANAPSGEGIVDNLICSICQDIFHDCVSLQPCLHSFCASCYSSWMDISKECPSCRIKVERISRNFIVNSLVEAFVKEHPDKKRSDEEIADMDAKNKITRDMMVLHKKRRVSYGSGDDEGYHIDDEEDDDDDDDDSDEDYNPAQDAQPRIFHPLIRSLFNPFTLQPVSTCIQCPGYTGTGIDTGLTLTPTCQPAALSGNATASQDQPSTSGVSTTSNDSNRPSTSGVNVASTSCNPSTSSGGPISAKCRGYKATNTGESVAMPVVPQYVCEPSGSHLLCGCCFRQMPDRRQEYFTNPQTVPSQKCDICGNFFCHLYWGCTKIDCNGCINRFRDLHFGRKCIDSIILKNSYESEIFKDYLKRKNLTWKDVLSSCLTKLDAGEYICQDGAINRISSANILCYHCGLKNFQELAYQYRRDIPKADLPSQITARPDCHWGSKCRTQFSKVHHAKNFNHVCEQTKFGNN